MSFLEFLKENKYLVEKVEALESSDLKGLPKDILLTRYYNLADEIANKNEHHPDYDTLLINFQVYKSEIAHKGYRPQPFDDTSEHILKKRGIL